MPSQIRILQNSHAAQTACGVATHSVALAAAIVLGFWCSTARAEEPAAIGPTATGPVATEPTQQESDSTETQASPEAAAPPNDPDRPRFDGIKGTGDEAIDELIASMTLAEKIGQMSQVFTEDNKVSPALAAALRAGEVGSVLNGSTREFIDEIQRIAREESPAGIPLLVGRDVIHGFRTIFPIPVAQAASWNADLVERAATIAANEAETAGINWTFAPMVDIGRDPRWGRIAESLGEDPVLCSALAAAMVRGFQQEQNGRIGGLVACPKHFAAYGLSEGGRDYNRASLSLADLHNVYLPPFHAAIDAGALSLMTTFSEVNGVPGTANEYLLRDVLRNEWKFDGLVVSDWSSVLEMIEHGFSADAAQAASQSVNASLDMEMVSTTFRDNLPKLVKQGEVSEAAINVAVRRILRVKLALAPPPDAPHASPPLMSPRSLEVSRKLARESLVLLKNDAETLPLKRETLERIAVIGPLADAPQTQMGCWTLDGLADDVITPLEALRDAFGDGAEIDYAAGAGHDLSDDASGIAKAVELAKESDVVLLFVGEDATLSGEARSRAEIGLPGAQCELVRRVAEVGTPVVMVVLAGRPLTIGDECDLADAVLYAWHPGTMGGPAIVDILLGVAAPSGKLPVTFPKSVGQIPLYYAHPNTGRPSPPDFQPWIETGGADLPEPFRYRSNYVDSDPFPLFPFGFGLSYTTFAYDDIEVGTEKLRPGQIQVVRAQVTNTGDRTGVETVQLYVRDLVASTVRPVRELKAFRRVTLKPGQSKVVEFALPTEELSYVDAQGKRKLEPGRFTVWVGGDSTAELSAEFELVPKKNDADRSVPVGDEASLKLR